MSMASYSDKMCEPSQLGPLSEVERCAAEIDVLEVWEPCVSLGIPWATIRSSVDEL